MRRRWRLGGRLAANLSGDPRPAGRGAARAGSGDPGSPSTHRSRGWLVAPGASGPPRLQPALDVLGVVALRFQRRLRDHLHRLPFEARPDPVSGLFAGGGEILREAGAPPNRSGLQELEGPSGTALAQLALRSDVHVNAVVKAAMDVTSITPVVDAPRHVSSDASPPSVGGHARLGCRSARTQLLSTGWTPVPFPMTSRDGLAESGRPPGAPGWTMCIEHLKWTCAPAVQPPMDAPWGVCAAERQYRDRQASRRAHSIRQGEVQLEAGMVRGCRLGVKETSGVCARRRREGARGTGV